MKKTLCMLLILVFVLPMLVCAEETVSEWQPVILTDAAGREVCIEEEPERVVSGYYISTSLIIALGKADKLVGIEAKAKSRTIYSLSKPEIIALPSVGSVKQPDLEMMVSLNPDLIILPLKLIETARSLEEIGFTVLIVNPESYDELRQTVTLVAAALGADDTALLGYYDNAAAKLETITSETGEVSVYLSGNSSMLNTAGGNMYQNTLIEMAGGTNAAKDADGGYWTEIGYEQLIAWNPEVIIIAADAAYTIEDITGDEMLSDIEAVKNGRVYALPSAPEAWDSPVPGAVLGSLWAAAKLWPEKYSENEFMADAVKFYSEFYGFELTEDILK